MTQYALFVFNGDPMCFIHVLLNALDMQARGQGAKIVLEGAATKLVPALYEEGHALHGLWKKCLAAGLVEGVCLACATKLGTRAAAEEKGLRLLDEMAGHPSIAAYRAAGCEVITF
ncbi:MAG: cytoplasmic protein [Spartobacteria bacterium]|nr:cytoplasmic protein [Spartobacteria bacterium]